MLILMWSSSGLNELKVSFDNQHHIFVAHCICWCMYGGLVSLQAKIRMQCWICSFSKAYGDIEAFMSWIHTCDSHLIFLQWESVTFSTESEHTNLKHGPLSFQKHYRGLIIPGSAEGLPSLKMSWLTCSTSVHIIIRHPNLLLQGRLLLLGEICGIQDPWHSNN